MKSASSWFWPRHRSRTLPLDTPTIQSLLGILDIVVAAFPDKAPRTRPHDRFHAPLLSQEHGQLLGARLPREVARRIGVQALVHDPLPTPLRLGLSQADLRVIGVRTRGHVRAVRQDI